MQISKISASVIGVTVAGLIGGSFWFVVGNRSGDAFAKCRSSAIAGGSGAIGGPFTLVSETGQTVTDVDVFTRPSLVYFGYTFCPDVCPLDAARNAEAVEILAERGYDVQPVFISIDPERDTPEVMAEYTDYLHEDMLGLTGSPEQVKVASKAYRTFYQKQDSGDEFYLVNHSAFTYLVLPNTGFAEFFKREISGEDMADSVMCFVDQST